MHWPIYCFCLLYGRTNEEATCVVRTFNRVVTRTLPLLACHSSLSTRQWAGWCCFLSDNVVWTQHNNIRIWPKRSPHTICVFFPVFFVVVALFRPTDLCAHEISPHMSIYLASHIWHTPNQKRVYFFLPLFFSCLRFIWLRRRQYIHINILLRM